MENSSRRPKQIRDYLKLRQVEMGAKIGLSQPQVKNIETGAQKLTTEIAKNLTINGWWLLTGQGTMLGSTNTDSYSLKASAGTGVIPYEIEVIDKYILDKSLFKTEPHTNNLKIIQVEGDSMEPTIEDGACIIIDETKTERIDGIYACLIDDSVFIKRLQFDLNGTIKIIYDNQKYEPKYHDPKNTQIFFKILDRKILTIQK